MSAFSDSVGQLAGSLISPDGLAQNTTLSALDVQAPTPAVPTTPGSRIGASILGVPGSGTSSVQSFFSNWLSTQTKNVGAWLAVFLIGLMLVALGAHLVIQD